MAWRCREPLDSLIIDDNQSQFDFIMGQEEEIIRSLFLMDLSIMGDNLRVAASISPPLLVHLFESSNVTRATWSV